MPQIQTLSSTEIDNRKAMTRNSQSVRKTVAIRDVDLINDTTIEYQGKRLEITKDAFKGLMKMIGMSQAFAKKFETLFNSETGEVLGAHLIGPDVTEMIATFGLAISSESTEDEFINTVFAHPTLSESIHESVLSAFEKPIHF